MRPETSRLYLALPWPWKSAMARARAMADFRILLEYFKFNEIYCGLAQWLEREPSAIYSKVFENFILQRYTFFSSHQVTNLI